MFVAEVEYSEIKVPVYYDGKCVYVDSTLCPSKVQKHVNRLAYGVKVFSDGDKICAIAEERSGLTLRGRKLLKEYFGDDVYKNQLPIYILAVVLGIAVLCNLYPDLPLCKGLEDLFWYVIIPVLALSIGLYAGKAVAEERG